MARRVSDIVWCVDCRGSNCAWGGCNSTASAYAPLSVSRLGSAVATSLGPHLGSTVVTSLGPHLRLETYAAPAPGYSRHVWLDRLPAHATIKTLEYFLPREVVWLLEKENANGIRNDNAIILGDCCGCDCCDIDCCAGRYPSVAKKQLGTIPLPWLVLTPTLQMSSTLEPTTLAFCFCSMCELNAL